MGWDGVQVDHKLTEQELKKRYDKCYNPVASAMVDNVWYGAVDIGKSKRDKNIVGLVILSKFEKEDNKYWLYTEEVSEDMGPVHYGCPEEIFCLLSPTDNQFAKDWRLTCWHGHCHEWQTKIELKANHKPSNDEIKKIIDKLYKPVESAIVNGVWYGAVNAGTSKDKKEIGALIVDTKIKKAKSQYSLWIRKYNEGFLREFWDEFFEEAEALATSHCSCPEEILDLLTPTDDENKQYWRELCRKEGINKGRIKTESEKYVEALRYEINIDKINLDRMREQFDNWGEGFELKAKDLLEGLKKIRSLCKGKLSKSQKEHLQNLSKIYFDFEFETRCIFEEPNENQVPLPGGGFYIRYVMNEIKAKRWDLDNWIELVSTYIKIKKKNLYSLKIGDVPDIVKIEMAERVMGKSIPYEEFEYQDYI